MKLNINPKEFLALYNLLHSIVDDDSKLEGDMVNLSQVHGRMKAYMLSSLASGGQDPVDAWFEREQTKINDLKQAKEDVGVVAKKIRDEFAQDDQDNSPLEEIEVEPSYPRMPTPSRGRR